MMMLYTDMEAGLCYSIKGKGGYKTLFHIIPFLYILVDFPQKCGRIYPQN